MSDPNPNITGAPNPAADKPAAVAAAPTAAVAPPKPAAPAPPKPVAKPPVAKGKERRFFLFAFFGALFGTWAATAWTTFVASMGLMSLGTLRFLYPNVLSEPPSKIKVGFPDNYEEGKVVERYKDQNTWVVRKDGVIYALSTTCTHLGCTPNWLEREQKFKCPCHGSGYFITGVNFEGPAPRPLERWAISVGDDGQLVVDKSRSFHAERDEWKNPDSFIKV
jgi:cytochrome b6-f complex iron-sulfur subunit